MEAFEQIGAGSGRRAGLDAGLTGADLSAGEPQDSLAGLGPDVEGTGLARPREQFAQLREAEGIEGSTESHGGVLPFPTEGGVPSSCRPDAVAE